MTGELLAIRPKDVPVEEWRTALLKRRVVATTHTAIAQVAAATLTADLQWEPRKNHIRQRRRRAPTDADMQWEAGTWNAICDGMRLTDATWVDQLLTHEKYQISALSLLSDAAFAWSAWNDITCKDIFFSRNINQFSNSFK